MSRNHLHLGVEVLTKILLPHNNGKAKISNTHLHTLSGMVPQTVNKTTHGESTAIPDGVEHRTGLSASQAQVDVQLCHIMHNERIFPSLQRRAPDIYKDST